jgi:hypothetical protein
MAYKYKDGQMTETKSAPKTMTVAEQKPLAPPPPPYEFKDGRLERKKEEKEEKASILAPDEDGPKRGRPPKA